MTETTTLSLHPHTRAKDSSRATPAPLREMKPETAPPEEYVSRFPKLPRHVERLRGQKICSYCKHTIDEDPYFPYEGYWRRMLQNKTYVPRYLTLEFTHWIAGKFYFLPKLKARLLHFKERILLPGWVRCAHPDCGQLYHASCWYQLKNAKGCLRCRALEAHRVD